ncbi:MAG: hypothetical protein AAF939_22855 [Planctomycetota bacterium]
MDLIYIILSILLRLSPVALNLSRLSRQNRLRSSGDLDLAIWIPIVGWASVSVKYVPSARWLTWQVYEIKSIDRLSLDSGLKGWKFHETKKEEKQPPEKTPDQG